jgi:succinate dehydrogenase / fumarate reductase membrane anchor subunit
MMERPRTLQQARVAYARNSEVNWWIFMRVSGLALVILVLGHLIMTNILIDAGSVDFEFVAQRLSLPWLKVYDSFLLGLAMLHGANGIRYSIEDYTKTPQRRTVWKIVLYAVTLVVLIFGIMSLWAADYGQFTAAAAGLSGDA